jgi:hypothetical protein
MIGKPGCRITASGQKQCNSREACFAFGPRRLKPAVSAILQLRAQPDSSAARAHAGIRLPSSRFVARSKTFCLTVIE